MGAWFEFQQIKLIAMPPVQNAATAENKVSLTKAEFGQFSGQIFDARSVQSTKVCWSSAPRPLDNQEWGRALSGFYGTHRLIRGVAGMKNPRHTQPILLPFPINHAHRAGYIGGRDACRLGFDHHLDDC